MGSTRRETVAKKSKSKAEVSKLLKIDPQEISDYEIAGLFEFADKAKQMIDEANIERIRIASTLKHDLEVNVAGIEVILNMREKMLRMKTDMNSFLDQVRHKVSGKLSESVKKLKKEMD